jgi:hypothetical protein
VKARFLSRTTMDVWGRSDWIQTSPLGYYSAIADTEFWAPAGFVHNLASIPRLARILIPVNGLHRYPAVMHDFHYAGARNGLSIGGLPRDLADDIFLEAMEVVGVPEWKRTAMHRAVRLGGARYWDRRDGIVPGVDMVDLEARTLDLINVAG